MNFIDLIMVKSECGEQMIHGRSELNFRMLTTATTEAYGLTVPNQDKVRLVCETRIPVECVSTVDRPDSLQAATQTVTVGLVRQAGPVFH